MSEMEFRVGKAIEVCTGQPTFEDKVNQLCIELNTTPDSLVDDWGDSQAQMKYRGEYFYVKGRMFKFLADGNIEEDYDVKEVTMKDGEYHFKLRFYNGGTNFEEMFEEALGEFESSDQPDVYNNEDIVEILDDIINYTGGTDSDVEDYIREIRKGYEN